MTSTSTVPISWPATLPASNAIAIPLDDALKKGDLHPAYDIFNVYLRRLTERTARIQSLLEQGFRFDVDESPNVDRKDAPWAASPAELDEIWRKRLKHEMLTLILSGKDQAAARTAEQALRQPLAPGATIQQRRRVPVVHERGRAGVRSAHRLLRHATPRISISRCACRWRASAACCGWRMNR